MKIVTAASGKKSIKLSFKEWLAIGKKAGWDKEATNAWMISDEEYNAIMLGLVDFLEALGSTAMRDKMSEDENFGKIVSLVDKISADVKQIELERQNAPIEVQPTEVESVPL